MSQHIKHGCDHIFFIGFLGAGKSTLARNVGTMFKRRFIDTDRLVVRRCGKSVTEIFETEGEDRFRELETSALRSLQSERSLLVSCGGGIVETPVNIELMHEMGTCVYLEGDFEDLAGDLRDHVHLRDGHDAAGVGAHRLVGHGLHLHDRKRDAREVLGVARRPAQGERRPQAPSRQLSRHVSLPSCLNHRS